MMKDESWTVVSTMLMRRMRMRRRCRRRRRRWNGRGQEFLTRVVLSSRHQRPTTTTTTTTSSLVRVVEESFCKGFTERRYVAKRGGRLVRIYQSHGLDGAVVLQGSRRLMMMRKEWSDDDADMRRRRRMALKDAGVRDGERDGRRRVTASCFFWRDGASFSAAPRKIYARRDISGQACVNSSSPRHSVSSMESQLMP